MDGGSFEAYQERRTGSSCLSLRWLINPPIDYPHRLIEKFNFKKYLLSFINSAAYFVHDVSPDVLTVRLGEWDAQTTNEILPHEDHSVREIVTRNDFHKTALFNNIALLFLKKPAQLWEHIGPVCLPPQGLNFDYSRCFVSGWGQDVFGKEGKYQAILKRIDLPVVPHQTCQTSLRTTRLGKRFILNKSFICAGGEPGKG